KIERSMLGYRPTPKQRSTLELLYARRLGAWTDADFRQEVDMFGRKSSRALLVITLVLSGCAAYRTQLFLYLKACGREELSTMNLWAGVDAPAAVKRLLSRRHDHCAGVASCRPFARLRPGQVFVVAVRRRGPVLAPLMLP